jgi:tetratricopeptide (TPR) repeat protein
MQTDRWSGVQAIRALFAEYREKVNERAPLEAELVALLELLEEDYTTIQLAGASDQRSVVIYGDALAPVIVGDHNTISMDLGSLVTNITARFAQFSTYLPEPLPQPASDLKTLVQGEYLTQIGTMLKDRGMVLLYGVRGVGKSTLVKTFCLQHGYTDENTVYLRCTSEEDLIQQLAAYVDRHQQTHLAQQRFVLGTNTPSMAQHIARRFIDVCAKTPRLIWINYTADTVPAEIARLCLAELGHAAHEGRITVIVTANCHIIDSADAFQIEGLSPETIRTLASQYSRMLSDDELNVLYQHTAGHLAPVVMLLKQEQWDPLHIQQNVVLSDAAAQVYALLQVMDDRCGSEDAIRSILGTDLANAGLKHLRTRCFLIASAADRGATIQSYQVLPYITCPDAVLRDEATIHQRAITYYSTHPYERDFIAAAHHAIQAQQWDTAYQFLTQHLEVLMKQGRVHALAALLGTLDAGYQYSPDPAHALLRVDILICRGILAQWEGKKEEAHVSYERALLILKSFRQVRGIHELKLRVYRALSEIYEDVSISKAFDTLEEAWHEIGGRAYAWELLSPPDRYERALLRLETSAVLSSCRATRAALAELDMLDRDLDRTPQETIITVRDQARSCMLRGTNLYDCGESVAGATYLKQAYQLSLQVPEGPSLGLVRNLGILHEMEGIWGEAEGWYQDGFARAKATHHGYEEASFARDIGILRIKQARLSEAEEYLTQALDLAQMISSNELETAALTSLAWLRLMQADQLGVASNDSHVMAELLADGLQYLARAVAGETNRKTFDQRAEIYRVQAMILARQGKCDEGLIWAQKAVEQTDRTSDIDLGVSYRVLGILQHDTGDVAQALESLERSAELLQAMDRYEYMLTAAVLGPIIVQRLHDDRGEGTRRIQEALTIRRSFGLLEGGSS